MPIAITGIGCRFPGGANSPAAFWKLLRDGVDAIGEIPASRMDVDSLFDPRPAMPGRMMTRWGGFLDDIESFDAGFFQISPREAERMDPAQRLLLETAWEALEDSRTDVRSLAGSPTGVFIGQWTSDYEARVFADPSAVDFYLTTGSGRYATAGRLSFAFGFQGPSLSIDTACSSSLAALHLACQSLRAGESSLALAGGVNIILQPHITIAYSQSRMMAPDGRCKFGDARGDGYVRSEGIGIVVLKPLARALADGDRIYATVRGSAVNNDGNSSGSLSRPSGIGQEEMLRLAYRHAGIDPVRVRYVEAHGTGTRAGDPVELGALGAVLGAKRATADRFLVGSVKTNIGHTEGAAGIAGVIKTALALYHNEIPASLHFQEPNPEVPWTALACEVAAVRSPWPVGEGPRVAGVSAFGIAGTNAHIVLEEAPTPVGPSEDYPPSLATKSAVSLTRTAREPLPFSSPMYVLPLSANDPDALAALATAYAELLTRPGAPELADVCATAALHRTPLDHRAAFVTSDAATLVDALRRFANGDQTAVAATGNVLRGASARLGLVFPGQGSQWVGMARELLRVSPAFSQAIDRAEAALHPFADWSLVEQLHAEPGSPEYQLDDIAVIQPTLLAVEIGLAALWKSLGVKSDAVVGHSMGEIAAAHVAGALSLEDAMQIVARRSALMRRTSGHGAMAMVELSASEAAAWIAPYMRQLSVAVNNAPRSSVLSGDPTALAEVLAKLERERVFCRAVKVDVASHSPQMDPLVTELVESLGDVRPGVLGIPFYSTVTGGTLEATELSATYWGQNLRQPVRFAGSVETMLRDGVDVFLELSPHPLLVAAINETGAAAGAHVTTVASLRRGEPEQQAILTALASLFTAGCVIDWSCLYADSHDRVELPMYPWRRERLWVDAANLRPATTDLLGDGTRRTDSDARRDWLHTLRWEPARASANGSSDLPQTWIVLAREPQRAEAIASALSRRGAHTLVETPERGLDAFDALGDDTRPAIVLLADTAGDAFLPISIVQALAGRKGRQMPRLWIVTEGAQVIDGEPQHRVSVDQSALWGIGRVLSDEHPEMWGGLIDLDPHADVDANAGALADALFVVDGEDQVALRHGTRFVLRLVQIPEEVKPALTGRRWRTDSAYLITGGLGEVAGYIAAEMVRHGARRLVLLGRRPLPPRTEWAHTPPDSRVGRQIAAIRRLEQLGAAVHVLCADVANAMELAAALSRYDSEGWPPIRGVIHAAGIVDNRLAVEMDRDAFERVLAPKLTGARNLDRLLPDLQLFVTFSSIATFFPQAGKTNYAAANVALDALMHDRRARGVHGLSIQWGVWSGTGVVAGDVAARNVSELTRQGIVAFDPTHAVALFHSLLEHEGATIAVFPVDHAVFDGSRMARHRRLFQTSSKDEKVRGPGDGATDPAAVLAARLGSASPAERRALIATVVREAVGHVLRLAPARIDPRRPLGAMGLDSLMALELRNRLESVLDRTLSATLAWNYPTVDALADYLAGPAGSDAAAEVVAAPTVDSPSASQLTAALGAVAALSDDDVARALRAGR